MHWGGAFHPQLVHAAGWVVQQYVIFHGVLQDSRNCIQIFMYSVLRHCFAVPSGTLAQFLAQFFQHHRPDLAQQQSANGRVHRLQHPAVALQCTDFVAFGHSFQPAVGVVLEPGVLALVDAGAEPFFQALGLRHNVLLDTPFRHLFRNSNSSCLHPLLTIGFIAITNCNFILTFSALLNTCHTSTSLTH